MLGLEEGKMAASEQATGSGVQAFRASGVQAGKDGPRLDLAGPEHLNTRTPEHLAPTFSYRRYREILRQLQSRGYRFAAFLEAQDLVARNATFALMRHDIDFDLEKALKIAEIEADSGVTATYFFMVRTNHYNVFSREGAETVSRILDLGHHLGLHFDCAAYRDDSRVPAEGGCGRLCQACSAEAMMLQNWFGKAVSIVSYHRPNKIVLSGEPALSMPLQHTYMPLFVHDLCYRSDSRGEWAFGDPTQSVAFKEGRPLHVLTHPIWWNDPPMPAREILLRFIENRAEILERSIATNCTIYRTRSLVEARS